MAQIMEEKAGPLPNYNPCNMDRAGLVDDLHYVPAQHLRIASKWLTRAIINKCNSFGKTFRHQMRSIAPEEENLAETAHHALRGRWPGFGEWLPAFPASAETTLSNNAFKCGPIHRLSMPTPRVGRECQHVTKVAGKTALQFWMMQGVMPIGVRTVPPSICTTPSETN